MVEGLQNVVKYVLFLANCIIFVSGIAQFAVGAWTLADRAFMERLLGSDLYVSSASILIATGVIVTLISFLGCCGAIKENRFMLFLYFFILFMIFVTMLVGAILGFIFMGSAEEKMHQEMVKTVSKYGEDPSVTVAWDAVQEYYQCCGVTDNYAWSYTIWQKQNSLLQASGKKVPDSCCTKRDDEGITACQDDPKNHAFNRDCFLEMKDFVNAHAKILGGSGIGISCVLIVGMMLACALFTMIKDERKNEVLLTPSKTESK